MEALLKGSLRAHCTGSNGSGQLGAADSAPTIWVGRWVDADSVPDNWGLGENEHGALMSLKSKIVRV